MMKRISDDTGLSLTELLVVSLLLGFILAAAWSVMYASNAMSNTMTAQANAADESQQFMDRISTELRKSQGQFDIIQAYDDTSAAAQGVSATDNVRSAIAPNWTSTSLTFYADLNGDHVPERIHYYSSGGQLLRTQASATATAATGCTFGADSAPVVIIKSIDSSWSGPIFQPLLGDAVPPSVATDTSQPILVSEVLVQMKNKQSWGDRTYSYESSSTVGIRNRSSFG